MTLASNCFGETQNNEINLEKLQKLSLDDKILYSTVKIKQFYIAMNKKVYVSFSGGKDSTVLLHLVRSIYPDTPAIYVDTGLEFPEIREFVKTVDNVIWRKPDKSFRKVIQEKGYPIISKEISHYLGLAQRGCPSGFERLKDDGRYGCKRYSYLVDAPFKISNKCCQYLKKKPAFEFQKESGRYPYIGMRADESSLRKTKFKSMGENTLENKNPRSAPLMIWTEADIWNYIKRYNLPYSPIYDMGYKRTGCIFCMYGITIDTDRFLKLKATHPKEWAYCMKPLDKGGLGLKDVLDYMGIETGCNQSNLNVFFEDGANNENSSN